ncbi:MAG: hypothetical protein ACAI25_16145, partial [Planctomycetota bacterium]
MSKARKKITKLAHSRRHLERLHEIVEHLGAFEGIAETVPAILGLASQLLHVSVATLVDVLGGQPRTFGWHAAAIDPLALRRASAAARRSLAYFSGSSPAAAGEARDVEADAPLAAEAPLETLRGTGGPSERTITLPLVVRRARVFGVMVVACG